MTELHSIRITINGQLHAFKVKSQQTLAQLLRERLHLTGTKIGCESGACGACAVLVNGVLQNSCLVLAATLDGATVISIEGLAGEKELHPLQKSFVEHGAIQCGFCTPGMVMASLALLTQNPQANEAEIKEAISGNICRCTGYTKIIKAVKSVADARSLSENSPGSAGFQPASKKQFSQKQPGKRSSQATVRAPQKTAREVEP